MSEPKAIMQSVPDLAPDAYGYKTQMLKGQYGDFMKAMTEDRLYPLKIERKGGNKVKVMTKNSSALEATRECLVRLGVPFKLHTEKFEI